MELNFMATFQDDLNNIPENNPIIPRGYKQDSRT